MKVKNKKIIVTGAGGGVGRNLAIELAKCGAFVIGADINIDSLNETKKLVGNAMDIYQVDISSNEKVQAFAKQVLETHPDIDGLINNAGIIQPFDSINELQISDIERVMSINFSGTLYMIKAFLPTLLTRPEAHITNVSSMGGFLPVPGQSIYGASKSAVKLMSEALYSELDETNVNVSIIFPGAVATDITKNSNLEASSAQDDGSASKILQPDDAAKQIIKSIEKNKFKSYLGKDCKTMHVMYKIAPLTSMKLINKMMKKYSQ